MYQFSLSLPQQNGGKQAEPASVASNASSAESNPRTNSVTEDSGFEKDGKSPPMEACLVCGAATRGMHFQVATCRACAAFFRRSVKAKKVYRCRRGNRDCDLTKPPNGKPICRYCRLQRCYTVGMRIENATAADDPVPVATTIRDAEGSSPEHSPNRLRVTNGNRLERNVDKLVDEIKDYFRRGRKETSFSMPTGVHSTPFQQLQYAFANFRADMCPPGPIPTADTYNKIAMYPFQEEYAKRIAQMMMSCDSFVELAADDKWKLFKHAWPLVLHIERQFSSCELFGYDMDDHRTLLTKELAIDFTKSGVYIDGMEPHKLQELMKFCFPLKQGMSDLLQVPIKQLQLTQFEVCYLVGLILFSVNDVKGLTTDTILVGEQLVDQFSTELHNYYTYEMKMSNYAARHAKLIRLISRAHQHTVNVKDHMVMAKIFDIFVTDVYESELYE